MERGLGVGVLRVSQPLLWLLMRILEGLLPTHKAPVFSGLSESPVAEDGIRVVLSYGRYLLCIRRRRSANDGQEAVMIFSSVKSEVLHQGCGLFLHSPHLWVSSEPAGSNSNSSLIRLSQGGIPGMPWEGSGHCPGHTIR